MAEIVGDVAAYRRDVRAALHAERDKLPRADAQGYALGYDQQRAEYRAVVTREQHVAAHGQ